MKVSDSSIHFQAEHSLSRQHSTSHNLEIRDQSGDVVVQLTGQQAELVKNDFTREQDQIRLSGLAPQARPRHDPETVPPVPDEQKAEADLNIAILRAMIERLTGKVMNVRFPQDALPPTTTSSESSTTSTQQDNLAPGYSLTYEYSEQTLEQENTRFSGEGIIHTEDGAEIAFNVNVQMSREFMHHQQIRLQVGQPVKDPLVIHFAGEAVQLSQTSFSFDLDLDGHQDQLRYLEGEAGYLALDRNNDHVINDGSELFGPRTGEGFTELAKYDGDNNGWIDENDTVYEQLRIWMRDGDGNNRLFSLGEKGVGAIYLHHIETPFSIRDKENLTIAEVRSSSVFIGEKGEVGTVQQIDIAV